MANRDLKNKSVRNIQRSHGTYYVSIPIELVKKLGWRERQKVVVKKSGKDKVIIKDWEK